MRVVILTDGKPGHENQSFALTEALERRVAEITVQSLPYKKWREVPREATHIIATGHKTHLPLLRASQRVGAQSIVLMRPSLPACFFSHIIAPEHDYTKGKVASHVILTKGMLCRLPEELPEKEALTTVMVGGPSKHYSWDADAMHGQLVQLASESDHPVVVGDSRRTPEETRTKLSQLSASYIPHEETERGWLPQQLAKSSHVWVSRDSMSMVYEALTSGAQVGLLDVPLAKGETRITRSVELLLEQGLACSFDQRQAMKPPHARFHEAARVADLLRDRL